MPKRKERRGADDPKSGADDAFASNARKVSELARQYTIPALHTLGFLMENDEKSSVRLEAARTLLEFGHGRPPVQVDISATAKIAHVVYQTEADFRQALLDRGIPARLLPPPLVVDTAESDVTIPQSDPAREPPRGEEGD
jgi:hypothetical protein